MTNFTKFTIFTILFLIFILPILMIVPVKMVPSGDQPGYGDMGRVSIYGLRDFKQVFLSKGNNLTAIGTTIKNPNLKNKKEIIFKLYEENNNLARTTILNGFNIGDGDFIKIVFDPIADSKNKKYYFTIASPTAGEEEIIELFLIKPTNEVLEYTYDEETKFGGIPMVTFHKPEGLLKNIKTIYSNILSKW